MVDHLSIAGNHALSDSEIEKRIQTTSTGWWPFAKNHFFDPVTWKTDLQRIVRLYESHGYYQAAIVKDEIAAGPKRDVRLSVVVDEKQPSHVGTLVLTGLDSLPEPDRAAALAELPIKEGDVFTEEAWLATKGALPHALRERGYAQVKLAGQALVDVKTQTVALTLSVEPGPFYRFGEIQVDTHEDPAIAPVWIWEQARLAIAEGEPYSDAALEEARRRITAMGLFGAAKVEAGVPDPTTGRIPILVETKTAPFHTVKAGAGARFDQIRNEARLISEWTNRDFLGGMRKLSAHGEAGWAFIPNAYAVARDQGNANLRNGPIARLRLEFEQPRFLAEPSMREQSSVELSRTLELSYNALGGKVINGVAWKPRASLTLFTSHHLEGYYLNGPPVASAVGAPLTLGCHTQGTNCFIWLSFLEEVITWDRRDNILEPKHGFYMSLSLQAGGGPLGGNFTYYRLLPDARAYASIGENDQLTFAARLRVGYLRPTSGNPDDSAVVTRFYGGGAMSMRGFNDRRLSPLLLEQAPPSVGNTSPALFTLPVGGNGMIDGSFETRYDLSTNLTVAAFVDFGQVSRGSLLFEDFAHLLFAVGLGLRYRTPVGPIRLDLARRLQVGRPPPLFVVTDSGTIGEQPYQVDDSCFGLGGSHRTGTNNVTDNLCVLHLSIGEAF